MANASTLRSRDYSSMAAARTAWRTRYPLTLNIRRGSGARHRERQHGEIPSRNRSMGACHSFDVQKVVLLSSRFVTKQSRNFLDRQPLAGRAVNTGRE